MDWSSFFSCPLPLEEGKCPPVYDKEKKEWIYPEPDPEYKDPQITETGTYSIEDKDEFYNYVTRCKACGTKFIAYDESYKLIGNYCPGCGKELK